MRKLYMFVALCAMLFALIAPATAAAAGTHGWRHSAQCEYYTPAGQCVTRAVQHWWVQSYCRRIDLLEQYLADNGDDATYEEGVERLAKGAAYYGYTGLLYEAMQQCAEEPTYSKLVYWIGVYDPDFEF